MGLTRVSIERPLALLMLIVATIIFGLTSYAQIPKDRFPAISFPFVAVKVAYPGAGPADVESLVTKPIEDALADTQGVTGITSTSSDGDATVLFEFTEDTDTGIAAIEVERKLAEIADQLPTGALRPTVFKADTSDIPIMNVSMSSRRPLAELYRIAVESVQPRLQSVTNVADVQTVGGLQREIQVKVDSVRLQGFGLTLADVSAAITRENVSLPSGRLSDDNSSVTVRTLGAYGSVEDLKRTPLVTGQKPVFLQDVAAVADTYAQQTRLHRLNGQDAIGFIVTKQSNANGVQVSEDLHAALGALKEFLPPDVTLVVTSDAAVYTRSSLEATLNDLKLAVIITAIILLMFLHTWRPTAIVLLSIPTSLIATFIVMYFGGFSLNMFSLIALALSIGILVDDSIVVLENIERHLEMGESPKEAALKGRKEIGLAALTITLVDVAVYLPSSFIGGNLGRLAREFGVTMAAATLFSLVISFTLTPMLASRFLRRREEARTDWLARFGRRWEVAYERLARGYCWLLERSLLPRGRLVVLGVAASTLVLSFFMVGSHMIGTEYAPQEDDARLIVSLTTPAGSSLQGTDGVTRDIEARIMELPEVETIFTSVGVGGVLGLNAGLRNASIFVDLKDKTERERNVFQILDQVRTWGSDYPTVQLRAGVANPLSGGGNATLEIRLLGDDPVTLSALAGRFERAVRDTVGAVDVVSDDAPRDPEIRAELDRDRLADLQISSTVAAEALRTAVAGEVATQLREPGGDAIDIRVLASDADRSNLTRLGGMPLLADSGALIRLSQIATLRSDRGPAEIRRADRQRVITISANATGRSVGDLARDIRTATSQIELPERYRVVYGADVERQEALAKTLRDTLLLSGALIYMLMVALYESLLTPLAIMFSIPVALVGAILGLWVTHNTFNTFSAVASVMLMGLVGKNAILLVDYANTLRRRGIGRREALIESGYVRLRPILMTTATIVFSMFPLVLRLEAGGESRAPMAAVIIGGVTSSTLLSLVLVPVMYTLLEDARDWLPRAWIRLSLALESGWSWAARRLFSSTRSTRLRPVKGASPEGDIP
jgi:HAE1 family hydrophobic/amphiphilic exporter-1